MKKVDVEDKTYRIIEMMESMEESMENLKRVIHLQNKLTEVLKKENDSELSDFLKGMEEQTDGYTKQLADIETKYALLKEVVKNNKENADLCKHCSMLLEALAIFK